MVSKIEWTNETWSVVTGCSPKSEGCLNCYAARIAATRLKHHPRYAGLAKMVNGKPRWTGEVRLNHDVLDQPYRWRKPRMIFVASMGDLFHEAVPWEFILQVYKIVKRTPWHTYLFLTKRPERMLALQPHIWGKLPNAWFGVSIENQQRADERISLLLQMPAVVRFVSCEPLLGPIDMYDWLSPVDRHKSHGILVGDSLVDWIIVGGESGPDARLVHPERIRSIRDQSQAAGVPFFFKGWGEWLPNAMEYGCYQPEANYNRRHVFVGGTYLPDVAMVKVGKKAAGRLLDGQTWDQMPMALER